MTKCPDCGRMVDALRWRYKDQTEACNLCLDIRSCKEAISAFKKSLRRHQEKLRELLKEEQRKDGEG